MIEEIISTIQDQLEKALGNEGTYILMVLDHENKHAFYGVNGNQKDLEALLFNFILTGDKDLHHIIKEAILAACKQIEETMKDRKGGKQK